MAKNDTVKGFILGISKLGFGVLGANGIALSDYYYQMLDYFPEVIKRIREYQALAEIESVEVTNIHDNLIEMLNDSYIHTANIERIEAWEKILDITPLEQGDDTMELWLQDRRETILARLYNTRKLNTETISEIVKIFTGGTAKSYFKDGVIHVLIRPPETNKQYKFQNVEQELSLIIPAHLSLNVERDYYNWLEVYCVYPTWSDVNNAGNTWNDILLASTSE